MPIEIECPRCRRKFRVPDRYAGKRVKCPECEGPIGIPAAGQPAPKEPVRSAEAVPEQAGPDRPTAQRWYLRTEEGQQFGPASREELDDWLAEGRIDASCQVLCEGWKQWKWADEVFPELAEDSTETQQAAVAGDDPAAVFAKLADKDQRRPAPPVSWWDRQFADFGIVALVLLPLCCNGPALLVGIMGLIMCRHSKARANALWIVIFAGVLTMLGFVLLFLAGPGPLFN